MHTEGHPPSLQTPVAEYPPFSPLQKQAQFNLGDNLGEAPSLPTDLANFLGGNAGNEWNDAHHPLAPSTTGSLQLPCNNGHPQHPIHTG